MTDAEPIIGTLGPETIGCLDLHDGEIHVHVCDAQPGGIVAGADDEEEVAAHGLFWRLSTTIRLHPFTVRHGRYPWCSVTAKYADERMPIEPRDPDGTVHSPYYEGKNDEAWFQWKGTKTHMTFTCLCGIDCEINGRDFVYNVMCPACRAVYTCDGHVAYERIEGETR